jgi:RNA polymerase sigma-70 factor (ECF subfamily)
MTGLRGVERADRISDEQLVAQAQAELPYNTNSFEALVRRHEPRVYEACVRYLGHEQDAEEVSQDIFVRVFHGLPKFERRASFRTWLFSVVRNECASRYRKRKRAEEQRAAISAQMLEERDTAVLALEPQQEWTGPVGETIGRLSEQDREVLVLRHVGQLSFQEIAAALGLGLSATKMRLYRAEERFRLEYDQAARSRAV